MRDKPCLTSADIQKAMAACKAEAEKNNWSVAIAIVDDGGYLLAFERMDGVAAVSGEVPAAMMSRLSLSTISRGVPLGT